MEFEGFRPRLEKELDLFDEVKAAKRRPRKGGGAAEAAAAGGDTAVKTDESESRAEEGKKDVAVKGAKRVKRDGVEGNEVDEDETEDEENGDGEGEGEDVEEVMDEEHDEDATEEEEVEEDDDEQEETHEDEDVDRVEDLDRGARRRMVDPDAADSDSDDEGPGNQLRGDMGLG